MGDYTTVFGHGISEKLALFDAEEKMPYALDDLARYEKPPVILSQAVKNLEVPAGRIPQQVIFWEVRIQYVVKGGIAVREISPLERN